MQLPSKLFSYSQSTLALFPIIMTALEDQAMSAGELWQLVQGSASLPDFLHAADALYALNKIDIDLEGRLYRC